MRGLSLIDCVVGANGKAKPITPVEAVERFIKTKKKMGLRKRSLSDFSTSLRSFCASVEKRGVCDIKQAQIDQYLESRQVGPQAPTPIFRPRIGFFKVEPAMS